MTAVTVTKSQRKHAWNLENRISANVSPDGNERTERGCAFCGLWKITVHPARGLPWREWRTKDGRQLIGGNTPFGCVSGVVVPQPSEVPAI